MEEAHVSLNASVHVGASAVEMTVISDSSCVQCRNPVAGGDHDDGGREYS
jgi:hypothetical protein